VIEMKGRKVPDDSPVKQQTLRKVVLIVGSDQHVADLVAQALPDWAIERTIDNRSALALLEARPFDLVLTGERTTGKEDVELLRKVRGVRPHLRLIVLTSKSTPEDVLTSMRERAFSYFSTPYSADMLTVMLRHATDAPVWDEGIELVSASTEWLQIIARCDMRTADRLLQFIHEISDLPEAERDAVGVAFREMLMNAIEHGGNLDPSQHVLISYVRARHAVICRIKDPGQGFSLDALKHAATSNPTEDPLSHIQHRKAQGMRAGGYGVLLAKSLVDDLIYSEPGNEVMLIKYIQSEQGDSASP
jgi:anti-sigma regulatory factor (Ser/Thr protein kinase)/ActR/RegA family two-component response regulator